MAIGYVQRYPFSAKAEWWKRHTENIEMTNNTKDIMKIEKNIYLRKFKFDCVRESDQQNGTYTPISGNLVGSQYLTLKTHNFSFSKEEPCHGDLIFYQDRFWMIEETSKTFIYMPRESSVLHISLKAIL